MSVKTISFFVLLFVSLTLLSCSNDPSAIGSTFLKGDKIKLDSLDSYPVKSDTLTQVSSTYQYSTPLGFANSLLLGRKGNNVASMLMSFNIVLTDSIASGIKDGSILVSRAFVQLFKSYNYGDSTAAFGYSVHKINTPWTSTTFTVDSFNVWHAGNQYDQGDIGSSDSVINTMYQFNVDPLVVNDWLGKNARGETPDNGILVTPSAGTTNRIVGFYALSPSTTVDVPFINIIVNKTGSYTYTDTLKFSTTADLSVVTGTIPQIQQDDYIYAQSSVVLESKLKFDISKLPKNAIINYAELQLTIDTTKSVFGSSFTDQLTAKYITDSTHIDSLSTSAIGMNRVASTSMYTGNITYYVQTWLSTKINNGIQILPSEFTEGAELWAIYGSKAQDPAKRPRLKITYTNKL